MTESDDNRAPLAPGAANPGPWTIDQFLDVTSLTCPMPLLKAKQALNRLAAGAVLEVRATDPGSERDFDVFARQSGHALLDSRQEQGEFIYVLRKKG